MTKIYCQESVLVDQDCCFRLRRTQFTVAPASRLNRSIQFDVPYYVRFYMKPSFRFDMRFATPNVAWVQGEPVSL